MISFIIPTLNEEKIIGKTLESLKRYSGEHEIIVSDGNSVDNTVSIAKKYTNQVIVYQGEGRQKISAGRNAGASITKGEYLVFMDADVFILNPDVFFNYAKKRFEENKNLAALCGALRVLPEFETWMDKIVFTSINFYNFLLNNILGIPAASGEFQMIRTEVFKKTIGFDESLPAGEDYEFFRRVKAIGDTRFDNKLVVYHTGRRAHRIGWLKLLCTWNINAISIILFKRAVSKEWTEIR